MSSERLSPATRPGVEPGHAPDLALARRTTGNPTRWLEAAGRPTAASGTALAGDHRIRIRGGLVQHPGVASHTAATGNSQGWGSRRADTRPDRAAGPISGGCRGAPGVQHPPPRTVTSLTGGQLCRLRPARKTRTTFSGARPVVPHRHGLGGDPV